MTHKLSLSVKSSQRRYRAREATPPWTPLDETIRNKICYVTARAIVPEGVQYYSARNLHVCSAQREALLCCV